jgi:hypothetical protein
MTAASARTAVAPPVRREEREWTAVTPKKARRKKNITTATIAQRSERAMAMPTRNVNLPRPNGTRRESGRAQAQGQIAATKMLPRTPRASAVTVTLSEAAKTSYAEVLARARNHISLKELGVERVEMRKAATGAIVIRVPVRRQGKGQGRQAGNKTSQCAGPDRGENSSTTQKGRAKSGTN